MAILEWINTFVFGPVFPILLLLAGLYICIQLRFFCFTHPLTVGRALFQRTEAQKTSKYSPFRALTLALAGTLGVGNIVGVAVALTAGGRGALFWMVLSAFATMLLKYCEIFLAVRYRRSIKNDKDTIYYGGPMYYISESPASPRLRRNCACLFAVLCIFASFTLGNMIQIQALTDSAREIWKLPPLLTGAAVTVIAFLLIFGGRDRISAFTVRAIPLMCAAYVIFSLIIILKNLSALPSVFIAVMEEAFTPQAAGGGFSGALLVAAMRHGVAKGVFSHEAGCGTASISHAGAETDSPARQGLWGIVEVFVDTVLLCVMTALVILVSWDTLRAEGYEGIVLTIKAYELYFGPIASHLITISVLFFAFATLVCWSYYGLEAVRFLVPSPKAGSIYRFLFCTVTILGAQVSASFIWELADFSTMSMTLLNTSFVLLMMKEIKKPTFDFIHSQKRTVLDKSAAAKHPSPVTTQKKRNKGT